MACNKEKCGCGCSITGLNHVGVFVKDIEESVKFYSDILGFECYFQTDLQKDTGVVKLAFIRLGSCELELVQLPGFEGREAGTVDHISLLVDDIDAVVKCLAGKGVTFLSDGPNTMPTLFDNGVKNIFFCGPDGERIELCQKL